MRTRVLRLGLFSLLEFSSEVQSLSGTAFMSGTYCWTWKFQEAHQEPPMSISCPGYVAATIFSLHGVHHPSYAHNLLLSVPQRHKEPEIGVPFRWIITLFEDVFLFWGLKPLYQPGSKPQVWEKQWDMGIACPSLHFFPIPVGEIAPCLIDSSKFTPPPAGLSQPLRLLYLVPLLSFQHTISPYYQVNFFWSVGISQDEWRPYAPTHYFCFKLSSLVECKVWGYHNDVYSIW